MLVCDVVGSVTWVFLLLNLCYCLTAVQCYFWWPEVEIKNKIVRFALRIFPACSLEGSFILCCTFWWPYQLDFIEVYSSEIDVEICRLSVLIWLVLSLNEVHNVTKYLSKEGALQSANYRKSSFLLENFGQCNHLSTFLV
jgi:hypothetical protein